MAVGVDDSPLVLSVSSPGRTVGDELFGVAVVVLPGFVVSTVLVAVAPGEGVFVSFSESSRLSLAMTVATASWSFLDSNKACSIPSDASPGNLEALL
ncbi:MAG: hypothetical protein Q7O66_00860 [Dehalococcoidia bacterium]|nr:hypothetical protein [Dehalococcoidia bacterium]